MSTDHFIQDDNITVTKDTNLWGQIAKAGAKVICVSKQGEFNGLKMRVPPPEFEALFFFTALESAAKAEVLKKMVKVTKSSFDGLQEIENSESSRSNFYSVCQNAMASVAFSTSAIESWANRSIVMYGVDQGSPKTLTLKRPDKPDRTVMSDAVPSDLNIPIRAKVFQLIPQVFSAPPLESHSTLRKQLGDIVDERNIIMHMQNKLNLASEEIERVGYAIKLFKTSAFTAPEIVLQYVSYIYEHSNIEEASWINVAKNQISNLKKKLR